MKSHNFAFISGSLFLLLTMLFQTIYSEESHDGDTLLVEEQLDEDVLESRFERTIVLEKESEKRSEETAKPVFSEVSGTIRERGTRKPLRRITFYVKELNKAVTTDKKGGFTFSVLPGNYTIIVPVTGYEKLETEVEVKESEKLELVIKMESLTLNPYQIVVRDKKRGSEVSSHRISIQEASAVPGANRDVLKVVTSMPGVNSLSVFNGYGSGIIIRGSNPEDNMFHVNDHWVPALYHFGGFESIIEPEMVESIDFYAGGFSPEFFEATGGVVKVNIRDPREDRVGGYFNLSLLSTSFMVEAPLSDKDSISISMKRGLLDLYTQLLVENTPMGDEIAFSTYPVYYDSTVVYTHKFSKNSKFKVIAVGSTDSMEMVMNDEGENVRFSDTISNSQKFAEVIAEWHYKKRKFKSVLSPMLRYDTFKIDFGERAYMKTENYQFSLSEKAEYKLNKSHTLKAGLRAVAGNFGMDSSFFAPPMEGEISYTYFDNEIEDHQDIPYLMSSLYLMDMIKVGDFLITPGAVLVNGQDVDNNITYADPRFSIKYNMTKDFTLKAATGLYSKFAQEVERITPWGTAGLHSENSVHTIGGFESNVSENLFLDVQGFYKHFYNMVVRTDPDDPTKYTNDGKGFAYGAEVLLRHNMTDNFFGWISYSYSVSKRKDGESEAWRYFDMDITHNLTAVGSYKPNKYWQIGARFKYSSGTPYTSLLGEDTVHDVDNNEYHTLYSGKINSSRIASNHQLDVRIDKYWIFDNWILSTYLDVQNVYMRKNPIGMNYNADYTEETITSGLPIMVFLGLKGDF